MLIKAIVKIKSVIIHGTFSYAVIIQTHLCNTEESARTLENPPSNQIFSITTKEWELQRNPILVSTGI